MQFYCYFLIYYLFHVFYCVIKGGDLTWNAHPTIFQDFWVLGCAQVMGLFSSSPPFFCIHITYIDPTYFTFYLYKLFIQLINGCLGPLLLCWAFSSCDKWGLFSSGGALASRCGGSSRAERGLQAHGLPQSQPEARCLWLCGCGNWGLPRWGTEPVSPAFAGGFPATGHQGISAVHILLS